MSLRTEIEKDIYELLDDLDPAGKNTERMRKFFATYKTDKEFYQYMDKFFEDPDRNFTIAYEAFNNPVNMTFIERVMAKHNVPLYERVFKPYINGDTEDPPATVHKIMVLDYPIKRLKQMIFKKNHTSTSTGKKDPRTGQVSGADKTARITDVEAFSLIVQGQYAAAQEYYGAMSDDTAAAARMAQIIQRDGEVELRDLPSDPLDKVTLNTINYYMLGSCISTNLVDQSGLLLPITMRGRDADVSNISR